MLDHGPSLEVHISPKCLLMFRDFASNVVNVLKILNFDLSAVLYLTVLFEAPGI